MSNNDTVSPWALHEYEHDTFRIDDLLAAPGIHLPHVRWNGWACPLFPLDSVRMIASQIIQALQPSGLDSTDLDYIATSDDEVYTWDYDEHLGKGQWVRFPAVTVDGTRYWAIGSHSWVWSADNDH